MTSTSKEQPKNHGHSCHGGIPLSCAQEFERIAAQNAHLAEGQKAMAKNLDTLSKVVMGNGSTRDSLLTRVVQIESSTEESNRSGEHFWKVFGIFTAVVAVIVAIVK